VVALVGATEALETFHSYAATFGLPLLTPSWPSRPLSELAVSLRPDAGKALLDVIRWLGWTDVIFLYSAPQALLRLQSLFSQTALNATLRLNVIRHVGSADEALELLLQIDMADR
jgi:hypothetical protein